MFLSNRNDVDHVLFVDVSSFFHLDTQVRCMKIGLVHDLAEALVGDITPHFGVSDQEKFKLESEAMSKIKSLVLEASCLDVLIKDFRFLEVGSERKS